MIIGWLLIISGLLVILSGIIGLYRFPDFYSKLHAAGIIDVCGIPLCLIGLASIQTVKTNSFKLIFATIIILILSPLVTQMLGKTALIAKKRQ